jgi:prevent-host-death family protein
MRWTLANDRHVAGVGLTTYTLYMSSEMAVSDVRAHLGPITSRAEFGGETVYLTKNGRRAAAIVPAAAAQLLEDLEDLIDLQAVEEVRGRLAAGTESRRRIA